MTTLIFTRRCCYYLTQFTLTALILLTGIVALVLIYLGLAGYDNRVGELFITAIDLGNNTNPHQLRQRYDDDNNMLTKKPLLVRDVSLYSPAVHHYTATYARLINNLWVSYVPLDTRQFKSK
eukprot:3750386-Pyramimonas_sp.AAC.2